MQRLLKVSIFVALVAQSSSGNLSGPTARNSALAASLSSPPQEETYQWRHVAIGGGGFITGYDSDRNGVTRVARADVYGAYLWRADLDRWVQLVTSATMPEADRVQDGVNQGVFEIVVAPSNPDRIYMAVKGHVYRSDNRGASFYNTSLSPPFPILFDANSEFRLHGPFLSVSPSNENLVLFGTPGNGLWRSPDGGRTWSPVESVPPATQLRSTGRVQERAITIWVENPSLGNAERIWAMSPGRGMYVSTDEARTFLPMTASGQPQPLSLTQGAFAQDGTFFGVDNATSKVWRWKAGKWTDLTSRPGLRSAPFAAVAVNPANRQIFVFEQGGRAYRSSDDGQSWVRLAHSSRAGDRDPPWLRVSNQSYFAMSRVTFDPEVPNRLWVGAGTGVYYADLLQDTRRVQWISQTRGIEELVANDVVQTNGNAPLFAAWDFGIHRKERLDEYSTGYGPRERVLIAAQQLDWTASDPNFIVTNASDTRTFCCSEDGDAVMAGYSLDGGRSWSKFAQLPTPPGTDAADPWRMSFGTIAVSAGSIDNIVWEPSLNRSPFYTKDRGRSWSRVVFPGEVLPKTGSHAEYYFHRKTLVSDRVAPGVFYLVHSGEGENGHLTGLWVTTDGGSSWHKQFSGEIAPHSRYSAKLRSVPGRQGQLFFTSGVAIPGDTGLRRSMDGGKTWSVLADIDRVDDIGFGKAFAEGGYPTIYISGRVRGRYGIWRSVDNAASWAQVGEFPVGTLDQVTVVAGDPNTFGRVYLGYKGSGWIYGQAGACDIKPYAFSDAVECRPVR